MLYYFLIGSIRLSGKYICFDLFLFFCPFFQVDLHFLKVLTGIATQGAISKETLKSYYVTTFKLEVSTNGEDWMVYRHGKNHKVGFYVRTRSRTYSTLRHVV